MVIYNLIDNSFKHGIKKEPIIITCNKINNEKTIISIKNKSLSISAEEMSIIFNPFYRREVTKQQKIEGQGLGLTLVQSILKLHGSKIEVNPIENEGIEFKIEIKNPDRRSGL